MADQGTGSTADDDLTVDQALDELRAIARRLDALPAEDADRGGLLARRDELRLAAQSAADTSRAPDNLEAELHHLKRRLSEIDALLIDKAWPEKKDYRWINDPSAYSRHINETLIEKYEGEREFLQGRIAQLEDSLNDRKRSNG